jgi:cytochrome c-type biogenesis protein CcmH/NrfG
MSRRVFQQGLSEFEEMKRKIHRRDAESAEEAQRKTFNSLRLLCVLRVSAVNLLPAMKTFLFSLYPHLSSSVLAIIFIFTTFIAPHAHAQHQTRPRTVSAPTKSTSASASSAKALTIHTEPEAIVWIDEVRRGTTDASGKLSITKLSVGRHTLRVRASGFREKTLPLLATQRGIVNVPLVRTTDEAELTFQQAEAAREKARDEESRQAAAELYRRALKLRPAYPAAHVGLARLLLDMNDYKTALSEIEAARAARPVYAEASAVEGRILRESVFPNEAIAAFRRSINEARGFQPEAHTGLARIYEDKGQFDEAAAEFRTAITQLSDTEPVLYQLLGATYERTEKYKEAVSAYEKYLELAPEGSYASAIRSIIDQLRQQAAEQSATP